MIERKDFPHLTDEEFAKAASGLVRKGLAVPVAGGYRLTTIGIQVARHRKSNGLGAN